MNFQNSYKIITNQSLGHYSHESQVLQKGPLLLSNCCARSLMGFGAEDAPELVVAGRRRHVVGVGMAGENQGVYAHPKVTTDG